MLRSNYFLFSSAGKKASETVFVFPSVNSQNRSMGASECISNDIGRIFLYSRKALMFVSPIHSSTLFLMVFYFDDDIASAGSIPIIPRRARASVQEEALFLPMLFLSSFIIPAALLAPKGDRKKVILVNNFWGH